MRKMKNSKDNNSEKRIFKIEVGKIAPEDVEEYVKKITKLFKTPMPFTDEGLKLPTENNDDGRD